MNRVLLSALLATSIASPLSAQTINDDFDRPGMSTLGPDWVEVQGSFRVFKRMAESENPNSQGVVYHRGLYGDHRESVQRIHFESGAESFSLIAGFDPATGAGVEARLLDVDQDGAFDRLELNSEVGSGLWNGQPVSLTLAQPLPVGLFTFTFEDVGDTAVATVRPHVGGGEQRLQVSGVLSLPQPPRGPRLAVGARGVGSFDNWTGYMPLLRVDGLIAGQVATLLLRGQDPGDRVEFFGSLRGLGGSWYLGSRCELSHPIHAIRTARIGHGGQATRLARVPAYAAGVTIYLQAYNHTDQAWVDFPVTADVQ